MSVESDGLVAGEPLLEFLDVMRRLRTECAWKREQTHRSLARYLLEETHETLEALDAGDAEHLCEELGDLLLQIYFHAVIAEESGAFTIDDVDMAGTRLYDLFGGAVFPSFDNEGSLTLTLGAQSFYWLHCG